MTDHKERLYIAGPITSDPDYREHFAKAEASFSEHYEVLNPARILQGLRDEDCMPLCLHLIDTVRTVVLLPGWKNSLGAVTEALYAIRQNKLVVAYKEYKFDYSAEWHTLRWDGEKIVGGGV